MAVSLYRVNVFDVPAWQANPVAFPNAHVLSHQFGIFAIYPILALAGQILDSKNFLHPTIPYIVPKLVRNSIGFVSIPGWAAKSFYDRSFFVSDSQMSE